ncbi:thiolase [Linderina pennispora]|uniref:Thiolase n=1 Tax=Linderina pennispora TaxID=61395 RepID=A0A1Y1WBR1_9FUNG|nr:thiolase [Linderina pennispora]ORX70815.1 thiolase [Linderina pennispora]
MATRLNQVSSHLSSAQVPRVQIGVKNPEDVVIVKALRTPMTRGKKGGFKDTTADYLLGSIFKGLLERTKIDPALVEDICVGNVCPPGGGATLARMAALYAGFPNTTSVQTVNRQCSSGLQAVVHIAHQIQAGMIEVGIGAGVESMTQFYGPGYRMTKDSISPEVFAVKEAADCLTPMGFTSENKAAKAQKEGLFDAEIYPIKTTILDKDGNTKEIVVSRDDGVRPGTTPQTLSKLKPVFDKNGSTTAGNASQVSDGAAALGLSIQGKFIAAAKTGLKVDDLDIVELNEAFASQAVYSMEKLGLDVNKLKRQDKRVGCTTMCIGGGFGMAAIFESEH